MSLKTEILHLDFFKQMIMNADATLQFLHKKRSSKALFCKLLCGKRLMEGVQCFGQTGGMLNLKSLILTAHLHHAIIANVAARNLERWKKLKA